MRAKRCEIFSHVHQQRAPSQTYYTYVLSDPISLCSLLLEISSTQNYNKKELIKQKSNDS